MTEEFEALPQEEEQGAITPEQVEEFIIANGIDERGADVLRESDPEIAAQVFARGDLSEMKNPSAALLARIRDARKGQRKGAGNLEKGSAISGGKGNYGYGKGGKYGMGGGYSEWGPPMFGGMPMYGGGKDWWGGPGVEQGWGAPGPAAWGPGKNGGGKSKSWGNAWDASPAPDLNPALHWLEIGPDSSIVQSGMPGTAPALQYEKSMSVFMSATRMLSDLVGDVADTVTIEHDADWVKFPEVGEAFKFASGEENCFAVASCPEHGVWGAGFGNGWKGQEAAAKVALCVALATGTEFEAALSETYPEFRALISGKGKAKGGGAGDKGYASSMSSGKGGYADKGRSGKACLKTEAHPRVAPMEDSFAPKENSSPGIVNPTLPEVHFITIQGQSTITELGFAPDAPACTHSKAFQEVYSSAHHVIHSLTDGAPLEFHHDTDYDVFPEVIDALKRAGVEENCFCVASCPPLGKWAVGLGSGWKTRESAGKLALAVSIAEVSTKLEETVGFYPDFGSLLASAGVSAPAAKKRKVGEV